MIAAGGAGGGGGDIAGDSISGGAGGSAGMPGNSCTTEDGTAHPGQPGTLAAGGAGGTHTAVPFGGPGQPGTLGQGGNGPAGGGGGGLFGGGGGAYMSGAGPAGEHCGAGGGGGSSGFAPSVANPTVSPDTTGQPSITLIYRPPPGPGGNGGVPTAPAKASFAGTKSSIRVGRNRTFRFSFGAEAGLNGVAVFRSVKRVLVSARRKITLARKPFASPTSGRVTLKVKLSKKNFQTLKRNRKIRTRVAVTLTNSSGLSSVASKVVTLKAPKRR